MERFDIIVTENSETKEGMDTNGRSPILIGNKLTFLKFLYALETVVDVVGTEIPDPTTGNDKASAYHFV